MFVTTRANARHEDECEQSDGIKHAIEGAKPVTLESIPHSTPTCSDGVDIDLSTLFDDEAVPENEVIQSNDVDVLVEADELNEDVVNVSDSTEISDPDDTIPEVSDNFLVSIPTLKFYSISRDDFVKLQREDLSLKRLGLG